jgi:hypothetical protein
MKWLRWLCVVVFALLVIQDVARAAEGKRPYQVFNRLRVEYDDNVYQAETDKEDSIKIIEELEFHVNLDLENTFVSLRYRPSFVWWDNREEDDFDFQNEGDLVVNHEFSPRLTLSVVDTLRVGQQPELYERGILVRANEDFIYNAANATLGYLLRPTTRLDAAGRYIVLRYDTDELAATDDYDLYVAGLTLRHQVVQETALLLDCRAEQVEYDLDTKGSQSLYGGAGIEQIFTKELVGTVRGGYQEKEFDDDAIDAESSPYADAVLTYLVSPATRITAGAAFSMYESDLSPFASQDRSQVFASVAWDVTARVSLYLSGAYTESDYSADAAVTPGLPDGTEELVQVSSRATYKVNRSNWIEAGWQYQDFATDYEDSVLARVPYERNRLDVGWKTQF